jgi:hypothetical protein
MLKKISKPNLIAVLITAGLLWLYTSMLPERLSGADYAGDGGDFMTAILTGGIPHPTGYPTYMILGRLFQLLPFGSPYYRAAVLSAVSAAMAAGLLYLWIKAELNPGPVGVAAALASAGLLGVSPLLWSQAVIVEVYALEILFLVLILWWFHFLVNSALSNRARILISMLSVSIGLAAGDHVTILLLAPVLGYGLLLGWRRGFQRSFLAAQAGLVIIGLLVYVYLPLQARNYPPINWGNPQSWQGFVWELSGNPYQGLLFKIPLSQLTERISAWARLLLDQFGVPGLLLGLVGLVQSPELKKPTRILLGWIFAVYTVFAIGYNTADSMVYLLPAFLVFAVWIGLGILYIIRLKWQRFPVGLIFVLGCVVYFMFHIPSIYTQVDPRKDVSPANYAESYLQSVPKNALLLTNTDGDSFPLWYYHFGLGWRPDVRIVVLPLTQFEWYQVTIQHTYTDLVTDTISDGSDNWGDDLVKLNPNRLVCRSSPDTKAKNGVATDCSTKPSP